MFYSTCADNAGLCSNPSANVTLTNQRSLLQKNQPYNIILDLELPESEANKQLGMFMVKVWLYLLGIVVLIKLKMALGFAAQTYRQGWQAHI